jgi:tetratricopeptide (TPR) repeat protein
MTAMRLPIRLGVVAALCAACSLLVGQATTDQIGLISSALQARQFDQALQLLQSALERSPKNAQLWTLRGIALSGKGEKTQALQSFRHALSVSPDYLPALEGAAQIEYDTAGKGAVALLQHVLALQPHDRTSHAMLAVLAYRRGDCATAVTHFEQSGPLLDSQPGALREYGTCLLRLNEMEKAISAFGRALTQSNADAGSRYRLASVQMMAQRPQDAIATLQPLLGENSGNAEVLELAASAYEAEGNTPEAVRILRQAIVSSPHDVDLYLDFANVSLDHQSYLVGVDMINAGLAAEPNAAPLYLARGILYVQLAQYDQAEADFERADELDPRQSIGSAAEGLAALQKNNPERALSIVRAKLARKPKDAYLLYLQAEILTQMAPDPGSAEFREAVDSARKAVSIRPSLVAARDVLAKLDLQAGETEPAIEESRKALTSDPNDQTALYHLIQALRKSRRTDELPELLKRLAELRIESRKEEAEHNRYKLVEEKSPALEKELP